MSERSPWLRRRVPLLVVVGLGFFVWKNGFGVLATERNVEWQVPVPYGDIRDVELQLWRDEALLKREERHFAEGVSSALVNSVSLTRGAHRAVAVIGFKDGSSKTFTTAIDPEDHPTVVVHFTR
jgi:hypothetical protein